MVSPCKDGSCGDPIMVADQNGDLYPVVDGRIQIPDYGPHPTFEVKAAPGSPFEVAVDPGNPGCYVIGWKASFNSQNELVSADGTTVLFTVPTPNVIGVQGVQSIPNGQGAVILGLKMDPVNPPDGFTINSSGCLENL